jgi:GNAT superfamily N-acetyltransferase
MNYSIKKIKIAENLPIVDELVGELHVSEKEMNDKTADWSQIRENYLRFMAECEEENDGTFLIAEIDGKAIGFLFGYIDEKDDSNFELGEGDDLYVSEGYVKKEYRKQGSILRSIQHLKRLIQIIKSAKYTAILFSIMKRCSAGWLHRGTDL